MTLVSRQARHRAIVRRRVPVLMCRFFFTGSARTSIAIESQFVHRSRCAVPLFRFFQAMVMGAPRCSGLPMTSDMNRQVRKAQVRRAIFYWG